MQPDKYTEMRAELNGRRQVRMNVTFDRHEKRADGSMTISGYGAVYNKRSRPIYGMFEETIAPGAFRKILQRGDDIQYLENHGGLPLARTSNGTLRLADDPVGIRITADLNPADPQAQSLYAKVERGDVIAQSFCFDMDGGRDQWAYATEDGEMDQRLILEFGNVYEFSAVGSPAYEPTTLAPVDDEDDVATGRSDAADSESRQQDADAQEGRGGDGEQPPDSGATTAPDQRDVNDHAKALRMRARLAATRSRRNHRHESCPEGRA